MKYAMLAAVLFVSSSLVACAPTASLTCGSSTCTSATQYCEQQKDANGNTTASTCKTFPTGCTGENYCDSCLSSTAMPNRGSCLRLGIGGDIQYTIGLRP